MRRRSIALELLCLFLLLLISEVECDPPNGAPSDSLWPVAQSQLTTLPPFSPAVPLIPPPDITSPFSQRVVSSLADIPDVIKGQIAGNPNKLRELVSNMLGGGLLAKLVTNPLETADEVGMPLEDFGINRTQTLEKINQNLEVQNMTKLFNVGALFGLPSTTPSPLLKASTTTEVMFIEGAPVRDFDNFIRRYNPTDTNGAPLFQTQKPPTPPPATPEEEVARAVLDALRKSKKQKEGDAGEEYFHPDLEALPLPIGEQPDMSSTLNENLVDPRRVHEINTLLRRSPIKAGRQRTVISTLPSAPEMAPIPIGRESGAPTQQEMAAGASLAQAIDPLNMPASSYDPQLAHIVDTLKSRSVASLSVSEVKDLQSVLQNFEQTLKTKELLQKKRELQAIHDRLGKQKEAIEQQKLREVELRLKEEELEKERQRMEQQLQLDLTSFQSGFNLGTMNEPFHHVAMQTPHEPLEQSLLRRAPEYEPLRRSPGTPTQEQLEAALMRRTQELHMQSHAFPVLSPQFYDPMMPAPVTVPPPPPPPTTTTTEMPATTRMPETSPLPSTAAFAPMSFNPIERQPRPFREPVRFQPLAKVPRAEDPLTTASAMSPDGASHGVGLSMSIIKKRPLPPTSTERMTPTTRIITTTDRVPTGRPVKESPFKHVHYFPLPEEPSALVYGDDFIASRPVPLHDSDIVRRAPINPAAMRVEPRPRPQPQPRYSQEEEDLVVDEFSSKCECIDISMERMTGSWVPSLASPGILRRGEQLASALFEEPTSLNCTKIEFSVPKHSVAAQDAQMIWHFRTTRSEQLYRLRGNALSIDHKTIRAQMADLDGNKFSIPFCVLKAEGNGLYDYMVAVQAKGPCSESVLFVRNPDTFFDRKNSELLLYLKHKINQEEMDALEAVPYASECSSSN